MMRRRSDLNFTSKALVVVGLWLATSQGMAAPPKKRAPKAAEPARATCVEVQSRAPYRGFGYDHIVELRNGCTRAATCRIKTDANPEVVEVEIPAGETREVVTFLGSPAAEFTPQVDCTT